MPYNRGMVEEIYGVIGHRVRMARAQENLSQEDLGKRASLPLWKVSDIELDRARYGLARCGGVWQEMAGWGTVGPGLVWLGQAWLGKARAPRLRKQLGAFLLFRARAPAPSSPQRRGAGVCWLPCSRSGRRTAPYTHGRNLNCLAYFAGATLVTSTAICALFVWSKRHSVITNATNSSFVNSARIIGAAQFGK
jgi:hypothetical protein